MPNIIRPKRSNTAAKVPNTTELTSGELGVNMADRKVYINNGTSVVQVGAGNLSGLGDVAIATPTNGQALTYNSTSGKWENAAAGAGTVTSVGITPGTGVTVSGSPITTSGNIAVGLSTKLTAIENLSGAGFITQNGSGAIAGRTLQAGTGISIAHGNGSSQDPIITNSAPDQTVALTGAGATSISGTYPNFTISSVNTTYSLATSTVAGLIELGSDTQQTVAPNAVSATASRSYALQVNAAGQGVVNVPWTDTNSGGTVTSVAVSGGTTGLTTSGGPVTTSGTITLAGTLALANGGTGATTAAAARTNLGATTLGGNLYTLANVAAIAFPRFNADNTVSSLDAASFRTAIGAGTSSTTGTVTSVGGTGTVSGLTLSGTVTTSGNLTLGGTLAVLPSNFASQTANTFLAAPNGSAGTPTFRAVVAADIPTLNQNTTGSAATLTTARTIQTNLASTSSASFNGSANITPGVTGTLPIANGGTNATTAAGALTSLGALAATNPSYTGTLTGGTGVINIGSNQFYKDANGNIGLGVVPSGWETGYKAIQGSGDLSFAAQDVSRMVTNCFYDGTVWKYISTGFAAVIDTNKTTGAFVYSVSTASGTAGGTVPFSQRMYCDGSRTSLSGSLRVNSSGAPEGDLDFTAQSDVRWLARGGRLDCVNNANTAWQTGVLRGVQLFLRTSDDTTRLGIYSDGRTYLNSSGARGSTGYVVTSPNESITNALRMSGYIEYQSDVGAIGVNYFNSDERLKKNIAPTQTTAREAIDAISFKQFDWNEYTDQDGVHVGLGVIAQQLQQINPKFVNVMSDSTLGVNEPELMTYALKAIQELSAELAAVKQELAQMKGVA